MSTVRPLVALNTFVYVYI